MKKIEITYCCSLSDNCASYNIKKRTMHCFLSLSGTVTQLGMQLQGQRLTTIRSSARSCDPLVLCGRMISKFWIICTSRSLVSGCIMSCIGKTICWWWCNLSLPTWWVASFIIFHWMRAQTFYLSSWSTIQTLSTLQDLIYLHLIRDLYVFKIRKL